MNKFLTSNIFLRYFREDETGNEVNETFISIADLDYSGTPIDPVTGDDLDNDCFLYRFDGEKYIQLIG